jgi:hypothetical protein
MSAMLDRSLLPRPAFVVGAALLAMAGLLGSAKVHAETWLVGPKAPALTLREALAQAKDGDTIALLEGEYNAMVGVVTQRQLTIRGIGKRPLLRAGGQIAEGKAMLVVRDGDVTVENLEFRGARAPDGNGAGIRFEKGKLRVVGCAFYDNENGILTGNVSDAELEIIDSMFGEAPRVNGSLPHLLYAGRIGKLSVSGSRFHEGFEGHLIKSRARVSRITYNMIFDGPGGAASYQIDLPNAGVAHIIGNVIGQNADAQNRTVVAYGSEGKAWPESALYMAHNTLLSPSLMPAVYLRIFDDRLPATTPVFAINNLTAGVGVFGLFNKGVFEGNEHTLGRWLRGPTVLDFALPNGSRLRNKGVDPTRVGGQDLSPKAEFMMPIGTRPIQPPAAWSAGAFQN